MAGKGKKGEPENDAHAWGRFERAVDAAVKAGPMHKPTPSAKPKERPASKGRVYKGKTRD
jgi:hypothetical protein